MTPEVKARLDELGTSPEFVEYWTKMNRDAYAFVAPETDHTLRLSYAMMVHCTMIARFIAAMAKNDEHAARGVDMARDSIMSGVDVAKRLKQVGRAASGRADVGSLTRRGGLT